MQRDHEQRPPRTFGPWALAAARNLDHILTAPRSADEPGSTSEAIALLLSPRMLGPVAPEGGVDRDVLPGCYVEANDPSGDVLGALYDAAFAPDPDAPDPAFRIFAAVDHESGRDPTLEAAGVLVGDKRDRLLFSEPGLPLPEICCSTLADLQRLHARVLSAAIRAQRSV